MIDDETLLSMMSEVWTSIHGTTLQSPPNPEQLEFSSTPGAYVDIDGELKARVVVYMSDNLAKQAASAFFSAASQDLDSSHAEDVRAEVANMVGGNIKSLLCPQGRLSLPKVWESQEDTPPSASQVALADGSDIFLVRVFQN